ncbi:ABC transporter ATP-binding protein [Oenococcus alcoholitolerans]|uniref:ABC transporter ATP-binding protein n=1 Tax=Oenococcus alcoholitolerans TaxID=931074 RepID=UPI003F725AD7
MTAEITNRPPLIEVRHIVKKFGDFAANDDINLDVKAGEIHALLGENGAGKSTLMNILSGLLQPTSGEIFLRGKKITIKDPAAAANLGIGMVHQHFMLVDAFTVTENIILGAEKTKGLSLNLKSAKKEIQKLVDQYKLEVQPDALISDISVGQQQRVEILKTLYRKADVLIFDEPTAVLTPQEIDELIQIMKSLAREGKAVIFITHKLEEIRQAADRVTVIRQGKSYETFNAKNVSAATLAEKMVGRKVSFSSQKPPLKAGKEILSIQKLSVKDAEGSLRVKDLDLSIKAGEIVGLAGIDGNGQTELVQAITGLTKSDHGKIILAGKDITNKSPKKIIKAGTAHIPEDRLRYGLETDISLAQNLVIQNYNQAPYARFGIIDQRAVNKKADQLVKQFDVKAASIQEKAGSLSGGNQQKAVVARELSRNSKLVIAAQPTRGLDVGAIEYIHKQIIDQRDSGKAVLLVSFELDEILDLSDRIAVISGGKIIGQVNSNDTNKEELGLMMTGVDLKTAKKETVKESLEAK